MTYGAIALVIRPGAHLTVSIPVTWYDLPSADVALATADFCVSNAVSLSEALDRYFGRYGHVPLAVPATAGSVLRLWAETRDSLGVWDTVWQWAEAKPSLLRVYHACQAFLECPHLVPGGQLVMLWERAQALHIPVRERDQGEAESMPDLFEIGCKLRCELARHYLGQVEVHGPDLPADRAAALAWWVAERVAGELTDAIQSAGTDTAQELQCLLDQLVSPVAELTGIEWDVLRPAGPTTTFGFGTMEAHGLWLAALLAQPAPSVELGSDDEPWVTLSLLAATLGGFPPPGAPPATAATVFGTDFDVAAAEWARRIDKAEYRRTLLEVLELRRELAAPGGLLKLVKAAPEADPYRQAVVCNAFRCLVALGSVCEADAWDLVSDSEWVRNAATRIDLTPLQGFLWGLLGIQRREGGRWHWSLPYLLSSLAEELELPPQRRCLLALAAVRSGAISGGMSAVRPLFLGNHRGELGPLLDEWREQFVVVRSLAPPLAAAYLRRVTAGLAR